MKYVLLAVLACAAPASAMNIGPGFITDMWVERGGAAFVVTDGAVTGSWPACSTFHRHAINTNTPAGQAIYASLQSALFANKRIEVVGTGSCGDWADSEAIQVIHVVR